MYTKNRAMYVVGFPRSGTTLLAAMLDRHSKICVPPESRFYEEIDWNTSEKNRFIQLSNSIRLKDFSLDENELSTISKIPNKYQAFRAILEVAKEKLAKEFICEKSPIHMNYISELIKNDKDAKIVVIVRDPRDVILSLKKVDWAHSSVFRHSCEWKYRINKMRQIKSQNILVIKYEELINNTEVSLKKVMHFLDIEFEKEQLVSKVKSNTFKDWESSWKGNVNKEVIKNNSGKWKAELTKNEVNVIESILQNEMLTYNYETHTSANSLSAKYLSKLLINDIYVSLRTKIKNVL
jgi:hypothetical protein